MPETYEEVEKRISGAIATINSRENVNRNKIAQEFRVPVQRMRSRLSGNPPASDVRGLHLGKLAPDQEKALPDYFVQLDKTGMPARLHMIEQAANSLLRMSSEPTAPPPFVGTQWAKRWLNRQDDLFKVKRKPLAAARKNAHDPELLMEYFITYKSVVNEFGILPGDQWNFDETGYRMGIAREDWVISVDVLRRIYSKCPDNRESLTAMECINGDGGGIPPILILTGIQQLMPWFSNDLDDNISITTAETGYTND